MIGQKGLFCMIEEPNILEQAFDILSSIPYLKTILKALFVVCGAFSLIAVWYGKWSSNAHLIKFGIITIIGNLFFAYVFRLWDKRDKERTKTTNVSK